MSALPVSWSRAAFSVGLILLLAIARAGVVGVAGPYRITLTSQPRVIELGKAKLIFQVADSSGRPLDGLQVRAIAAMPGMFMGEREVPAVPTLDQPGTYSMSAAFPMAGRYEVRVAIKGPLGEGIGVLAVQTGQDLGEGASRGSLWSLVPWVLALAVLILVVVRMRATGQKLDLRAIFSRGTILGLVVLVGMLAAAIWAVRSLRRDGAMTPLEAQVMEMNTPAPPGSTAVQLAQVQEGEIAARVRYTGQAVGFVEQDVVPRVAGTIVSMPVYVGEKVNKGQVLARLDTSQIDPQLAERAAMTDMASKGVDVAVADYRAALEEVTAARADVAAKEELAEEAASMVTAAREDQSSIEAEVAVAEAAIADAKAEVIAAESNRRYWNDELARSLSLYSKGALSRSELQEAERDAAEAEAKHKQAQQRVLAEQAKLTGAIASVRKAESMVIAAVRRSKQAQADVRAAKATVRAKEAAADSAKKAISRERASLAQAQAGLRGTAVQRGYAELKSEVDGVVTQRLISPGVTVSPGQAVLRVAQVTPIRLQANVAAADLAKIRVGAKATIRSGDEGDYVVAAVTSVSPAVDLSSRTGIVEVVWPNEEGRFFPGQFVSMEVQIGSTHKALVVPRQAIQRPPGTGTLPFVWVASAAEQQGEFSVRRSVVETGVTDGESVAILEGLSEGQWVVVQGGATLRDGSTVTAVVDVGASQGLTVRVTASGFEPSEIEIPSGKSTTITFLRVSEEGCGTEVMFPTLGIEKALPLNRPIPITLTPKGPGYLKFSCGMDMMRGTVVVK